MKILGIETSCDETACAIVDENRNILSNIIYSQVDEHKIYGGVVPEIASRAHIDKIEVVIDEALKNANCTLDDVDAIAVTAGPGLIGGLIVGLMSAKGIASAKNKPLVCVNHLEGHLLTCRLTDNVEFPFLLLLVSGGHCQFIYASKLGEYKILGETLDDSAGEAFDKTAKLLGLGYPGGPIIEKLAKSGDENSFKFTKPLFGSDNCNFSFSGLKTAVLREVEKIIAPHPTSPRKQGEGLSEKIIADICASFQKTTSDIILDRLKNALKEAKKINPQIKNFVISGGVAANKYINGSLQKFCSENEINFFAPPLKLCTDNAAMIAWAGLENFKNGYQSSLDFIPQARWSLEK
ncbi:MAG: tRNA (adenosine(37)-N6)-threonylcarbamoyltransferase complex transferase subunit TsaD [Rickettsiales bacterium]|nr:tRNA (adenosine(37)-N6)-threonylcarbamoyltransferase complex transferase subunit TsaD [Rickettsiales bacterium]